MKKYISYLLTGILGGVIALSAFSCLEFNNTTATKELRLVNPVSYSNTPAVLAPTFDFRDAARMAQKAVVQIKAQESRAMAQQRYQQNKRNDPFEIFFGFPQRYGQPIPQKGAGSGVIISKDGYIVTNNHVIDFADEVEVTLNDDRTYSATIVGTDATTDLAVLKIDADNLPTLKYANSETAEVGEWVLAVGNPFDQLTSTVTAGIISAKARDIDFYDGKNAIQSFIQTDAVVNPGNSGGALVNVDGELLGINTAIYTRTGSYVGYSFAIPVNLVNEIVDDLIRTGKGARDKMVSKEKPSLGIYFGQLNVDYAKELGLTISEGIVVDEVISKSAAEYAGIQPQDVIVSIDDRPIRNSNDIFAVMNNSQVGDVLKIEVYRKGRTQHIPVKLKAG